MPEIKAGARAMFLKDCRIRQAVLPAVRAHEPRVLPQGGCLPGVMKSAPEQAAMKLRLHAGHE